MVMKKKGIEMQVHWIFILIAGAVILAFFFSVAAKQKSLSEEKLSITLSSNIEAVFAGAVESKGTAQPLMLPKGGIEFSCSEVCDCNFIIGSTATQFRDKIIFAPSSVEDQDAVAWSAEWKMPFRVTNLLYITNPNIKYYLIYLPGTNSERLFERVNKDLHPGLNLEVLDNPAGLSDILYEGFQETKFVFLDVPESQFNLETLDDDFSKTAVSAVNIHQNTITFYEKEPRELIFVSDSSPFVGEQFIFAAMFAADQQMYDCGLQSAFRKLFHVASVIKGRAELIQQSIADSKPECVYLLGDFDVLISASKQLSAGFDFAQGASSIMNAANNIEKENKNLILLSCPELY
jgi:hypothetical protein